MLHAAPESLKASASSSAVPLNIRRLSLLHQHHNYLNTTGPSSAFRTTTGDPLALSLSLSRSSSLLEDPAEHENPVSRPLWHLFMRNKNLKTLGFVLATVMYLLMGAALFQWLETPYESNELNKTSELNKSLITKYKLNQTEIEDLLDFVFNGKAYKAGKQWGFAGSIYFATTVVTVIGYGFSTPRTPGGKLFCMLYALPGIPLCMIMFQSIGERMNSFLMCFLRSLKRLLNCHNPDEVSHSVLIIISGNLCFVVFCVGAAMFHKLEGWSLLDSAYYCVITLTTVGFGDLVPLQTNKSLENRPDYVAFTLLFILVGLTVISSAMNLFILKFLRAEQDAAAAAAVAVGQLRPISLRTSGNTTRVSPPRSGLCNGLLSRMLNMRTPRRPAPVSSSSLSVEACEENLLAGPTRLSSQLRPLAPQQAPYRAGFPLCCIPFLFSEQKQQCWSLRSQQTHGRIPGCPGPRHYTVVRAPAHCVHHLIQPGPSQPSHSTITTAASNHRPTPHPASIPSDNTPHFAASSSMFAAASSTDPLQRLPEQGHEDERHFLHACPHITAHSHCLHGRPPAPSPHIHLNVTSIYALQARSRRGSL